MQASNAAHIGGTQAGNPQWIAHPAYSEPVACKLWYCDYCGSWAGEHTDHPVLCRGCGGMFHGICLGCGTIGGLDANHMCKECYRKAHGGQEPPPPPPFRLVV